MNGLKTSFESFTYSFPDYGEVYSFFSSHDYTRLSKSRFIAYMKCLFDDNPFGIGIQNVARDNSGEMIGYMSLFSVPFLYSNISVFGGQIMNVLVNSKFRGQGIFLKMLKKMLKNANSHNFEFVYAFPNPASYNGFKKEGWETKDLSYWTTKLADNSEFEIKNKYMQIKKFSKIDKTDFNNNLFQINKNLQYLTWRFIELGNFFDYEVFKILDDSDKCLGFVVMNEYKEKQIIYGQILDAIIPLNNIEIYQDILNFYCNYYKEKGISNLQFFQYSTSTIKHYLISRNFSLNTKNRFFVYCSNNQNLLNAIKSNDFLLFLSAKDNV